MKKISQIKDYLLIILACIIIYYSLSLVYDSVIRGSTGTIVVTPTTKVVKPDSLYGLELKKFEIFDNAKSQGYLPRNKDTIILGYNINTLERLKYLNSYLKNFTNITENVDIIILSLNDGINFRDLKVYSYKLEALESEYGINEHSNFLILVDNENKIRYFTLYFNENNELKLLLERFNKEVR